MWPNTGNPDDSSINGFGVGLPHDGDRGAEIDHEVQGSPPPCIIDESVIGASPEYPTTEGSFPQSLAPSLTNRLDALDQAIKCKLL